MADAAALKVETATVRADPAAADAMGEEMAPTTVPTAMVDTVGEDAAVVAEAVDMGAIGTRAP